ncbi:MAG: alpha/beta hydrolase [Gemmatimonadaceae bacterium]
MTSVPQLPRGLSLALAAGFLSLVAGCSKSAPNVADTTTAVMSDSSRAQASPTAPAPAMAKPDSQMQAVLDQLTALGPKPLETLTAVEARKQPSAADAVKALLKKEGKSTAPDPAVTTVDRSIPGPGGSIPVRVYTPVAGKGPFPVIVYYHGGGWVVANIQTYDAGARALSKLANAVVVSVGYRQAPEHKFPAAHDDAFAAYQWALKNAHSIKGDSTKVATAGERAGGNLAIATAMAARDAGVKLPVYVLSVYPIAGSDTNTVSYRENAMAKPLSKAAMVWFLNQYARTPADWKDPRIDLVHANLKGLPPTTVITDQIDPLRSEGEMLAQNLKNAGVDVRYKNFDGVTHEFFGMGAVLDKAKDANQYGADGLKGGFSK